MVLRGIALVALGTCGLLSCGGKVIVDGGAGGAGTGSSSSLGTSVVSSSGGPASIVVSSPASSTGGQGTECYRDDQALAAPGSTPDIAQSDCSSAQIDSFFQACFNGGDCDGYQSNPANEICLGCLLGGPGDHFPPLLLGSSQQVYVNHYACESMAQNLPQCAAPTSQFSHCTKTACETCSPGSQQESCEDYAADFGICSVAIDVPVQCQPILSLDVGDFSPPCSGTTFEAALTNVSNYICGPGM